MEEASIPVQRLEVLQAQHEAIQNRSLKHRSPPVPSKTKIIDHDVVLI